MDYYPPAPWSMHGLMYMTLLKMPPDTIPTDLVVPDVATWRPDRGQTLAVGFVDYLGGDLSYREFLVATTTVTLTGPGTILAIWVDDPRSVAGGRELWNIPKQLGSFDYTHGDKFTGTVSADGRELASYTFTGGLTLPGRWPLRNVVVQGRDGVVRRTKSVFRTKMQLGSGQLEVPEDSPVAFLRAGKVLRHMALPSFTVRFGLKTTVVSGQPVDQLG